MRFEDTITYIEVERDGFVSFIGGSCKAKDLRRV